MRKKTLPIALLAALVPLAARADDPKVGFVDRVYKSGDKEYKYVLFVPHDYKPDSEPPVILFLHGKGSGGTDGKKQARVGLAAAIRKDEKKFPSVVVFPQSEKDTWAANSDDAKRAIDILAEVQKEYKTDSKRVYLTGLSMGGFGTWALAAKYPDKWAAIVPICGGGNAQTAAKIKDIPCWCFHGDADPIVDVEQSRRMIKALKDAGGSPKYDEFEGVGHNAWDRAYAKKELYEWLLMQKLK
jgi:predicted peptidase